MKLKKNSLLSLQITLALMLLFQALGVTNSLTEYSIDKLLRYTSHPQPEEQKVIIISIDNSSIDYILSNTGYSFPWSRDFYAHILDYLKVEEAKAVLFDIMFYDGSRATSESESGEYDALFAKAIQAHGNVYLAAQLSQEVKPLPKQIDRFTKIDNPKQDRDSYYSINLPIDVLMKASAGVSAVNIQTDRDGILRYAPIYHTLRSKEGDAYQIPSFPIGLIEQLGDEKSIGKIPIKDKGYRLNWYSEEFQVCPIKAVLQSAIAMKHGGEKTIPEDYFNNAIVLIGATADGLNDLKHTPMGRQVPGINSWATLLLNTLTEDHINYVPTWLKLMVLAIFITLMLLLTNTNKFFRPLIFSLTLIALIEIISLVLWIYFRYYFPASTVALIGLIYLLSFTFLSFSREYKERMKIRNLFSRYISKEVVRELEKNPYLINLGGEEVKAAVMFSDVYDFTALTETMSAKELVEHLNIYFSGLSEYITTNNGLLEAFLGDGILAVFGVPVQSKQTADYSLNACRTAIEQRDYVRSLSDLGSLSISDKMHTRTRIGIATGDVIAGNVGSPTRMDYTVIGDAVNIASRLESANKFYKTNVIICEGIFADVKDEYVCRKLDKLRLKGKSRAITIYELVDKKTVDSQNVYYWIEEYEKALQYYFDGDFHHASTLFKALSGSPLEDGASNLMHKRCATLLANPPGSGKVSLPWR